MCASKTVCYGITPQHIYNIIVFLTSCQIKQTHPNNVHVDSPLLTGFKLTHNRQIWNSQWEHTNCPIGCEMLPIFPLTLVEMQP